MAALALTLNSVGGGGLRLVVALKGIDRVSGFAYRGTHTWAALQNKYFLATEQ